MALSDTGFTPFSGSLGPLTRVAPFTHRDNETYLRILMELIKYINSTLVEEVNVSLEDVLKKFTDKADELAATITAADADFTAKKADWQALFDAFMADVTAQIALLNDSAVKSLLENAASVTGLYLRTLVYTKTDADTLFETITGGATKYAPADDYALTGADTYGTKSPVKQGIVLDRGADGQFDSGLVESLTVIHDPESGRLAGVYTGYNDDTLNLTTSTGSIGLAYSDDGLLWEKAGVLFSGSGIPGTPDVAGCTGPVVVLENGVYHLFYIGLSANGYEGGTKTLMLATSPSLKVPVWTRQGPVLQAGGTGWRSINVWHPSFIKHGKTWYCFINANGVVAGVDRERIGYATATALTGPWTFNDVNSPVLSNPVGICGDPSVSKIPGGYRMDYFTTGADGHASDWFTTTTDAAFPTGWRQHSEAATQYRTIQPGPLGTMDDNYAHKPFILRHGGRVIHYYTAVDGLSLRRIAAATTGGPAGSRGPSKVSQTQPVYGAFSHVMSDTGSPDVVAGTSFTIVMVPRTIVSARPGDLLEFTLNYGVGNEAPDLRADVCLLDGVGGTAITYVSGRPKGITGWAAAGGVKAYKSGTYQYRVLDTDIVNGAVIAVPVFKADTGTRTVYAMDVIPMEFSVRNLG